MYMVETDKGIEYINGIDDIHNIVGDNIAEVIRDIVSKELDELEEKHENLEYEFKSYESSNESLTSCLHETIHSLNKLKEELRDCKRMNRSNILDTLESIHTNIYNYL